jgi:hypothetical protein
MCVVPERVCQQQQGIRCMLFRVQHAMADFPCMGVCPTLEHEYRSKQWNRWSTRLQSAHTRVGLPLTTFSTHVSRQHTTELRSHYVVYYSLAERVVCICGSPWGVVWRTKGIGIHAFSIVMNTYLSWEARIMIFHHCGWCRQLFVSEGWVKKGQRTFWISVETVQTA